MAEKLYLTAPQMLVAPGWLHSTWLYAGVLRAAVGRAVHQEEGPC